MRKGEEIVALRDAGWSNKRIAEHYGMPKDSVRRLISETRTRQRSKIDHPVDDLRVKPVLPPEWGTVRTPVDARAYIYMPPPGPEPVNMGRARPVPTPTKPRRHVFIPDTQCAPGDSLEHLTWAGKYIAEMQPDVLIHAGDHWHMDSLSSYETKGSKFFEGRRYKDDIAAGNEGLERFEGGLGGWQPKKKILLRGNHSDRITRAINDDPRFEGVIGFHDFNDVALGWTPIDYLTPVEFDGMTYSHYFYNPNSGRSYSGSVDTMLRNIGFSFCMGHQQGMRFGRRELNNGTVQIGIVAGCLTPDHRVLTADLRYVPIGDLKEGDKLVSFDEHCNISPGRGRRFRTGTLLRTAMASAPVFAVRLVSGKTFKVTEDHGWLAQRRGAVDYHWRMTNQLKPGDKIPRVLPEWEQEVSFEAGWLAGIMDGEGHLYARATTAGTALQMAVSQKRGLVLDHIHSSFKEVVNLPSTAYRMHDEIVQVHVSGGVPSIVRVLGSLRPVRLLAKFRPEYMGGLTTRIPRRKAGPGLDIVEAIEPLGTMEIVRTEVDCGTLVVEGYPHHNSFYQKSEHYRGPQAASEWRGLVVLNEVAEGNADIMQVSLGYLRRKFG